MCVQDNGIKPLRCLDVFAGCGGLSLGLHQSRATESKWAIEFEPRAAEAFKLNFPDVAISTDDCNIILKVSCYYRACRWSELPLLRALVA